MSNNSFHIGENTELYLRIPRDFEESDRVIQLILSNKLAGKYVKIEVLNDNAQDMPVRAYCKENQCKNCGVMNCTVHCGNAELKDIGKEKDQEDSTTIPGHPNCHYGECYNCHVVSCAIQQGWENIPVQP